ncbi:hypothetical protein PPTG_21885 [Phytophthora nicotianae INRA-310]|uniref:Uncharacterized protein n=1 Tax=Phytophthora nicotianae (strain INRA-310) TaxID=761204 RepID=W2QSP1_PHYN3|nr:hypothetical protein PPTG_21885 [Phytophthora nicotianae INRA-310]ETN16207.1 hypothetical protein PPTG_21885 [Phytophthora nicotianae INRA-310]
MPRWFYFFAEYNFSVEYKPARLAFLTMHCRASPTTILLKIAGSRQFFLIASVSVPCGRQFGLACAYLATGKDVKYEWITSRQRSRLHRYVWTDGPLQYRVESEDVSRVVAPWGTRRAILWPP